MASIQVGSTHSTRRPLDSELPLVPFIDLLLCCVMFLLVTAVWNRMAAVEVATPAPGPAAPTALRPALTLSLRADGWLLVTAEGARFPMAAGDVLALTAQLATLPRSELRLATDDGVPYEVVVSAIDAALAAGVSDVSVVGDGAL
jgi:biopolymer transport protein ExbD